MGLYDPYPEPELWEPSENSLISLLPSSGIPSGRCMLDGIPVFCSDAEHLLQTGAAEFKKPDVAWQDDRWVFVTFNRETREYEKPVFSRYDYTSVKTEDGRESGKWHAVFEGVAVSETANLFRLFAFRPSRRPEQSKNKTAATAPQESAMDIAQRKNCATPNSTVEQYKLEFEAQWNRTLRTGEENGSAVFYEQASNNYMRISLSEGRHIDNLPAMPESRRETRNARDYFSREGRTLYLLAFFHTHPNYAHSGESQSGNPSDGDIQFQSDFGNAQDWQRLFVF